MLLGVVAILVAIATTGYVQANGDYFIVCPNLIRPGQQFECEVSYVGSEASIMLDISLGLSGETPLVQKSEQVNGYKSIGLVLNSIPEGTIFVTTVGKKMDGTQLFTNSTQVKTEQENSLVFIQSDKAIYKPGDRVKYRIICVDQQLKAVTVPTDIFIYNPDDSKVDQKLAAQGETGVIESSFLLDSNQAKLGEWRIEVKNEVATTVKKFTVDEYVLPKFDVKVTTDKKFLVTGTDTELKVTVVTRTTYGKAIQGKAKFIFRNERKTPEAIQLNPDESGSHTETFSISMLESYKDYNGIRLTVNVTEDSTDVTQSSDEITIKWYDERIKMEFLPTSATLYRPGLPFTVFLKLTDITTGSAPAGTQQPVMLSTRIDNSDQKQSIDWDNDGLAMATFDVPASFNPEHYNSDIYVSANMNNGKYSASWKVKKYRAKLNASVTVELTTDGAIQAGQDFSFEVESTAVLTQVAYMVLARGRIVDRGQILMGGTTSKTIAITATRDMSPGAKVFVYGIMTSGKEKEVIADSVDIKVSGVFGDNELEMSFSKAEVRPGEEVDVTMKYVNGGKGKFYILAVDESVLLMMTGNDMTKADVIKRMMGFDAGTTPTYNDGPEPHGKMMGDVIMPVPGGGNNDEPTSAGELLKTRGLITLSGVYVEESPPQRDFPVFAMAGPGGGAEERGMRKMVDGKPGIREMNRGLVYLSGMVIEEDEPDFDYEFMEMDDMEDADYAEVDDGSPQPVPPSGAVDEPVFAAVGRTRTNFKETWMWLSGTLNSNGLFIFSETVPDTITDFVASAFALSETKGLAITADTTSLRVFQPFFVSVTLKYSIIRGESFTLRVSVSNYLQTETPVQVTLERSDDFEVIERNSQGQEARESKAVVTMLEVKPGIPGSVSFEIAPKVLGDVKIVVMAAPDESTGELADRIEKTVLVKPEGFIQRRSESRSLELSPESNIFSQTIALMNTPEIVSGSRKVFVDACGDVMGKALNNLGRLVTQPTGCGEQNMITFVPNIVVNNYLSATNRLTPEIKEKTEDYMKTGYQRELTYMLNDGSFSAFGESDGEGSTWLSAFVVKSFSQAEDHISPDRAIMKKSLGWLLDKQNSNGTFKTVGRVIHQEMLGGSAGGKAMTAFVFIALKESEQFLDSTQMAKLGKTKTYLEGLVQTTGSLRNAYEKAIIAYALQLADSDFTDQLLQDIETNEDKPWEKTPKEPEPVPVDADRPALFDHRREEAKPTDIETWSYVLLTYANKKDLAMGNKIMKWLIEQQNGGGGFKSTQDTVLGLQALAEYAALAYTAPKTDISLFVTARAPSGDQSHTFLVQKDKLLLLQTHQFPDDTTAIDLYANGSGLAIVNVKWNYNTMKEPMIVTDKKIRGTVETNKIGDNLFMIKGCISTPDKSLGMTINTMSVQSGYVVTNSEELKRDSDRVDIEDERIVLYYNEVGETQKCAQVKVMKSMDLPVNNAQPAAMTVQAYYHPDVFNEVLYTVEDSAEVDICTVCQPGYCPQKCSTSEASTPFRGVLLSACIALLVSLIVAL